MTSGRRVEIDYDKIYTCNTGDYKIIRELPEIVVSGKSQKKKRMVEIKFLSTGTIKHVPFAEADKCNVHDPYYPTVGGVGCLGDYKKYDYHCERIRMIWTRMIRRCYTPNEQAYDMYGGAGVKVEGRWHCYENFLADLPSIPGFYEYLDYINGRSDIKYDFDKDYIQDGVKKCNKVYSRETCMFIPKMLNLSTMARDKKGKCSSIYYGVHKLQENGHFQATVNIDKKKHFLGTFRNEIEAAVAYNNEILRCTNHPEYYNLNEFEICKVVEKETTNTNNIATGAKFNLGVNEVEFCKVINKRENK